MSKIFLYIFFVYSIFSFSQNENLNQIYVDWENPKNFEKYNVKKVTVYSKEIKKNGKIKKDSLLLAKYEYETSQLEYDNLEKELKILGEKFIIYNVELPKNGKLDELIKIELNKEDFYALRLNEAENIKLNESSH